MSSVDTKFGKGVKEMTGHCVAESLDELCHVRGVGSNNAYIIQALYALKRGSTNATSNTQVLNISQLNQISFSSPTQAFASNRVALSLSQFH